MTIYEILTFVIAASLLVMSPGPNGVLIAKTVPTSGRAAGFANVAGFVAAFYVHGTLSILGVSIILMQIPVVFGLIKWLGAGYLFYIGVKAIISVFKNSPVPPSEIAPAKRKRNLTTSFIEGFLTNALNPKVSMFYLAAFPQFISADQTSAGAAFFLVFLHSMINAIWFGMMVVLFSSFASAARSAKFQKWLKATTGVVFIGFAGKLATLRADL